MTEASMISPAQLLQRARGGASTLAEQVIGRELGERGEGSQALNMMMQGMVSMMSSGRSSSGQRWASRRIRIRSSLHQAFPDQLIPRTMEAFSGVDSMLKLNRAFLVGTCAGALALSLPCMVRAHAIESALEYLDGDLQLRSSFSTGAPAAGAVVRLLNADGSAGAELGQLDAKGALHLTLPALEEGTVDLQIDGGPGHRDYLALPIRQGRVEIDAVGHSRPSIITLIALLGGAGASLYGWGALVGRVRRSRNG